MNRYRITRRRLLYNTGIGAAVLAGSPVEAMQLFASRERLDELAALALQTARSSGAEYADIRLVRTRNQTLSARNDRLSNLSDSEGFGFGVRCLVNGAWGFASSNDVSPESIRETARLAAEIGRASGMARTSRVKLADEPPRQGAYRTPRRRDPFETPLEKKAQLLLTACEALKKTPEIRLATGNLGAYHTIKHFVSTEGARLEIDALITSGGIVATAVKDSERQSRRYAVEAAHGGWERIEAGDLAGNAPRVADEAKQKLQADEAPTGKRDLVLDPLHLYLTIHESIGHATELDRVLGYEADYAGTSWVSRDSAGKLRYGSKHVNIVADNTYAPGLASTGFDDEGVECQKWDIVREGVLVGFSDSRETASLTGRARSHGSCRAEGWNAIPIVRIANVGLAPGSGTAEDLIQDVKDGVYISGSGTFSIDQRRLNFQFGGDMFYKIKDGKKAGLLKDVVYRGITPQFWGACDGVAGSEEWKSVGVMNCGKGQPGQSGRMSHGASHARFRGIEVGRGKG